MKSTFNADLTVEKEVNMYLDTYIYPILSSEFGLEFTRIHDKDSQHKGIDTEGSHKLFNDKLKIDEKTATHYFKNNLNHTGLKTFALELSYLNKHKTYRDGWLFNSKYSDTNAYLFSWGWTTPDVQHWRDIRFENIIKIESVLVMKKDLLRYLDRNYNFNKATFSDYIYEYQESRHTSKFFIKENSGPYIFQSSNKYAEAPTNLIFPKEELINISKQHIIHYKDLEVIHDEEI
ncbi:hypothetical protein [Macrococcoides caseolyticum]|uniref:hypothetical protein n=1 Tax=Macrococcoides caseolyticum TaxID=69966 RepID=UPI001F207221|nr:hypothetical protein [Macrococcus caseolyticus]MCE4957995.1 hypothetical protein [Macrococcus caseolyticus]